jgi:hypothetical protein
MKNYINNTELSITYIYQGEVETSVFDTDQEFKDFMYDVFLIVSTSREFTEIPDTEIVENYNALRARFGL